MIFLTRSYDEFGAFEEWSQQQSIHHPTPPVMIDTSLPLSPVMETVEVRTVVYRRRVLVCGNCSWKGHGPTYLLGEEPHPIHIPLWCPGCGTMRGKPK